MDIAVSLGAKKYVGGTITELTGKDISSASFQISLGTSTAPGTWKAPDVSTAGATAAQRVVKLLVDNTTAPGTYYCWIQVTDTPEVEPIRINDPITVH